MSAALQGVANGSPSRANASCRYKDKSPETETRPDRAGRLRRAWALPKSAWEGLPKHVQSCFANRHRLWAYFLWLWNIEIPGIKTRAPYFCQNWRCPHCAVHESHVLYARIVEAFEGFNPKDVVFLVLTLPPEEHLRGKSDLAAVYREFSKRGEKFTKRMRRWMAREGMTPFGGEWVSTVEAHKSGMPHINYMIHSPELATCLRLDNAKRLLKGQSKTNAILIRGELQRHLSECGFGWRSTAEALRLPQDSEEGVAALAGYITKLAGNADATHGELAKVCQVPVQAPSSFRRVRSGRGFLPARRKGEMTGTIIRRRRAPEGDEEAEALTKSKDPEYLKEVRACERKEQELIYEDEKLLGQKRIYAQLGVPLPRRDLVEVHKTTDVASKPVSAPTQASCQFDESYSQHQVPTWLPENNSMTAGATSK